MASILEAMYAWAPHRFQPEIYDRDIRWTVPHVSNRGRHNSQPVPLAGSNPNYVQ